MKKYNITEIFYSKSYKEHLLKEAGVNTTSEHSRMLGGKTEIKLALSTSQTLYKRYAGSQI